MNYSDYDDMNLNEGKIHDHMDDSKLLQQIRRSFMGLKAKPYQVYWQTLKKHEYPGYINLINKTNYTSDLRYIRNDISSGITIYKNLKELYKRYKKGEVQNNKMCQTLEKQGVEIKDFDPTIKWFQTVARDAVTKRMAELKEKYPRESVISTDLNYDHI